MMESSRTYTINNSKLTIKFGNIITSSADIIVSSDDYILSMGGGASAAIYNAAGPTIRTDARKMIPATLGDVIVTTAGNMPQKYIFHVITIDRKTLTHSLEYIEAKEKDDLQQYIIHHAIKKIFRIMSAMEISSIAFPAIGAGVAGIPYKKVAECMGQAFAEALSITNKAYDVELWLFDRFGKMELWDFIPFFEAGAKAELYCTLVPEVEKYDNDYSNVVIKDVKEQTSDAQVFISYSRADLTEVRAICDLLNKMNISYWIDVDGAYSGDNFKAVIVEAIEKADLVLFVSSANSNASKNVSKEISLADKLKKTILPIRLDDSKYASEIEYDLIGIDYIDYTSRNPATLEKLRKSILGHLVMEQKLTPENFEIAKQSKSTH